MALRSRHGNARRFGNAPVLETLPVDELPSGVQAPLHEEAGSERRPDGTFAKGACTVQRRGGKAKAGKSRLASRLGLKQLPDDNALRPYRASGETFRLVSSAAIAATVGGGTCGPIPSSMLASGALALQWSRFYLDHAAMLTADPAAAAEFVALGTKLAEQSSTMLRQAHEYAAKEATARAPSEPDFVSRVRAEIAAKGT